MPVIGGWSHGLRAVRPSAVHRHIERQRAVAHLQAPPVLPVPVAPPVQVVTPVELPTPAPVEVVTPVESKPKRRRRAKPVV